MSRTPHHQAIDAMTNAQHLLICFPEQVSGDGVATSLGLARAIERIRPGHQVDVISSGFSDAHRHRFRFLPGIADIQQTIARQQRLTIRIPCDAEAACDITHRPVNGAIEIEVTPHAGQLVHDHIATTLHEHGYDLIVVMDCPDLTMLGQLYTEHATLFQKTPILAIDHAPDHEQYGHLQLIDITAAACGEVVANFLHECAPEHLDADVATCLLAGILSATRSFRSTSTHARTFEITSMLLANGARRDEILANLFRTKTIGQLQLWGRALTRLKTDPDRKIVWALLGQHDFLTTNANESDLPDIIDELLVNASDAQLILLCSERPDRSVAVLARAPHGRYDAAALLRPLGGSGNAITASASVHDRDLVATERLVLETVRARIPQSA